MLLLTLPPTLHLSPYEILREKNRKKIEKTFKKVAMIKTDYEEGWLQPPIAGHPQLATPSWPPPAAHPTLLSPGYFKKKIR
jgi:hypothetical protein